MILGATFGTTLVGPLGNPWWTLVDPWWNLVPPLGGPSEDPRRALGFGGPLVVPESCARFVTCQDVGKLLSTFQKLGADTEERELRALTGHDEDAKVIFNRYVFVEVREHVIRPELRKNTGWPAAARVNRCARRLTCFVARAGGIWARN